jgi:hypothetical protein
MRPLVGRHGLLLGLSLLGGCQTIIGISHYEIDPGLDGAAGEPSVGGDAGAGGSSTGEAGAPGGAAGAPAPEPECATKDDCDDTIGCTVDACEDGTCTHAPDRMRCLPEAGECLDCQLNIGCVAVPAVVQELLVDPSLDNAKGEWDEYSDHNKRNIFVEEGAQSGTRVARMGPSPPPAMVEEYADLSQVITIPEHTSSLRLTGFYRLTPGTLKVGSEYAAAALYELGELNPVSEFHNWQAVDGAQSEWKQFSFDTPRSEVLALQGHDLTFDVIAHVFESEYRFDTLSLQATICE